MQKTTVQLVFGLKVRLLRQDKGLTLQQLVDRTGIAISYLHDIENGKKYPSLEKISVLATALETPSEQLMAPRGMKQLDPVIELLESDFFQTYPLQVFGLQPASVIESMAKAPEKLGAFISTILKITRSYHLTRESLNMVALRSFQDMHDNYFGALETAAQALRTAQGWPPEGALTPWQLEQVLSQQCRIRIDRNALSTDALLRGIRSYFNAEKRTLYLNRPLSAAQENFLISRELGFQLLGITENRPYETSVLQAGNFDTLMHNFQASYFASALLMDEAAMKQSIRLLANMPTWQPEAWLGLLNQYNVTAEMFLQRLTNLLPTHFGIKDLFFLRMDGNTSANRFDMTKELHLSGQQSPYSNAYGAHYCRRWISIDILRRLRLAGGKERLVAAAQLSEYWQTPNQYLCISMAKPHPSDELAGVSVTIGMRVNDTLRGLFKCLQDPNLSHVIVNTTCETCTIVDCVARAAPPLEIEANERLALIQERLRHLG